MENPAWLGADEQRVWRGFLRVNAWIYDELEHDLRERGGLGLIEYGILVHLSEAPGRRMRMRALADSVIVSKSRLSHQIARLERGGLVRKEECTDDRRGLWAVLTDEGSLLLDRVAPGHAARVRALLFDRLGPRRTAALEDVLTALEADGDAPAAGGRPAGGERAAADAD
ncbi:MarR family winged helix-turn-helix transcriptional regulator [Nocardiopsis flavescens]|uniref:DNA-binding transcriptional regulator, MarR family n=1 Tax=Nocardiopsis flavescens TaxID=758803 RepID=A0A1M6ESV4_9ACTN|nr:MarR family transcriptional regulator [Nocardiopsis flavescens]SHI88429.1 DNA-binding transcriptional regulator, MarR family [Nocardiopsis flavescens]